MGDESAFEESSRLRIIFDLEKVKGESIFRAHDMMHLLEVRLRGKGSSNSKQCDIVSVKYGIALCGV